MDKIAQTVESYNHCADSFVQLYTDLGWFEPYFREVSDLLKEGAAILDLGCGPGNVARFLMNQHKGYQVVGVDLSAAMLQYANQYVPGGEFILADLRYLALPQTFDAVIASFCIIHFNDGETADLLRKTFDFLKDGGYFYLSFMHGGTAGFEKTNFSGSEMFFFNYFTPEAIMALLEETGFRVLSTYRHDYQRAADKIVQDIVVIAQKIS